MQLEIGQIFINRSGYCLKIYDIETRNNDKIIKFHSGVDKEFKDWIADEELKYDRFQSKITEYKQIN